MFPILGEFSPLLFGKEFGIRSLIKTCGQISCNHCNVGILRQEEVNEPRGRTLELGLGRGKPMLISRSLLQAVRAPGTCVSVGGPVGSGTAFVPVDCVPLCFSSDGEYAALEWRSRNRRISRQRCRNAHHHITAQFSFVPRNVTVRAARTTNLCGSLGSPRLFPILGKFSPFSS